MFAGFLFTESAPRTNLSISRDVRGMLLVPSWKPRFPVQWTGDFWSKSLLLIFANFICGDGYGCRIDGGVGVIIGEIKKN